MDLKQNPFSVYDFLGYLTPGAIFLYGWMAAYAHAMSSSVIDFISTTLSFSKAEIYIPFVLFAYATGHVLSFLSSILIERYSIWSVGYPSKYLLGIKERGYLNFRSFSVNDIVIRLVVAALLAPIAFLDWFLGRFAGFRNLYAKSLDVLLINIIKKKLVALMREHGGLQRPPDTAEAVDFFRYAYHYTVERAPRHFPKMQNYVALYGFLRTLTLLSVFLFWSLIWHATAGQLSLPAAMPLIFAAAILSFTLYMAFVKFYRRFSLEALMALAATYQLQSNNIEG